MQIAYRSAVIVASGMPVNGINRQVEVVVIGKLYCTTNPRHVLIAQAIFASVALANSGMGLRGPGRMAGNGWTV